MTTPKRYTFEQWLTDLDSLKALHPDGDHPHRMKYTDYDAAINECRENMPAMSLDDAALLDLVNRAQGLKLGTCTNEERADRGAALVEMYRRRWDHSEPDETALCDLLADLIHRFGDRFDVALDMARIHYQDEAQEETSS